MAFFRLFGKTLLNIRSKVNPSLNKYLSLQEDGAKIYDKEMNTQVMQQTIADYFKTQPVLKAWLFGSFARDEETSLSDVDIIVLLDRSKPVGLKFFGMWSDLEKLLNRSVDLVEEGELLPFAAESANRDKRLIYERTA